MGLCFPRGALCGRWLFPHFVLHSQQFKRGGLDTAVCLSSSAGEHSRLISCVEERGFGKNDLCSLHFLLVLFLSYSPSWLKTVLDPSFSPLLLLPLFHFRCRMILHSSACSTTRLLLRTREAGRQTGRLVDKGTTVTGHLSKASSPVTDVSLSLSAA